MRTNGVMNMSRLSDSVYKWQVLPVGYTYIQKERALVMVLTYYGISFLKSSLYPEPLCNNVVQCGIQRKSKQRCGLLMFIVWSKTSDSITMFCKTFPHIPTTASSLSFLTNTLFLSMNSWVHNTAFNIINKLYIKGGPRTNITPHSLIYFVSLNPTAQRY